MDGTAKSDYALLAFVLIVVIVALVFLVLNCEKPEEEVVQCEALEQRFAAALAAHEALAAQRAAALQSSEQVAPPPPVQVELPYFPYAGRGGRASKCAICLEPLRQGQPYSEVSACRHAFHRDCLGLWAKGNGSCPLCRAKIVVLGSGDVTVVEDMV